MNPPTEETANSSIMESATSTSVETATSPISSRRREGPSTQQQSANGASGNGRANGAPTLIRRYRHVAAIHSKTRPSTLSHDAAAAPSFLGFRNLMVITLGMNACRINSYLQTRAQAYQSISCGKPSFGY